MSETTKRSTLYLEKDLLQALRLKAATLHHSLSDLVNEAVRSSLSEDQQDLAAFDKRAKEPTLSYEALLKDLKTHGKI